MSGRRVTIVVANQVNLPRGVRIVRAEVLLAGRMVARLPGPYPVVRVSLVGLLKGAYTISTMVRTSTGKLLKGFAIVSYVHERGLKPWNPASPVSTRRVRGGVI